MFRLERDRRQGSEPRDRDTVSWLGPKPPTCVLVLFIQILVVYFLFFIHFVIPFGPHYLTQMESH